MELFKLSNKNLLPFRFKKIKNGKIFLSNDFGERVILDTSNFKKLIEGKKIDIEIEQLLKQKNILKQDDFEKKQIEYIKNYSRKWLNRYHYLLHGPSLHIIVVTLLCNLSCSYCHASAKQNGGEKYNMTIQIAKKVVETIFHTTSGSINIEFQGGEPLLNFEVVKFVIDYANELNEKANLNMNFSIVTNLTLMDDEKLDFLIKNNVGICTSLDGPKDIHDFNRKWLKGCSSFDKLTEWIKKINLKYEILGTKQKVGAIATITKKSLNKYKEIIDTYIDLGIERIFVRPLNPYGYAKNTIDKIGFSSDLYNEFYIKYMEYINQKKSEGVNIFDVYSGICTFNLENIQRINYMEERNPCGAGLGQLAYNFDGGIYTCDEGRMLAQSGDNTFKIGEIDLKKTGKQIYKSILLNNIIKIMALASQIDYIPGYSSNPISNFIGTCPIYSYTKNGNIISKYRKEDRFIIQENIIEDLLKFK